MNKEQLFEKYKETYPTTTNKGNITRDFNTIWNFIHEINIGDIVVARKGTREIIGYGTVTGPAYFDVEAGRERFGNLAQGYANFIPVKWEEKEIQFPSIVFSFYTMYEIDQGKFEKNYLVRQMAH